MFKIVANIGEWQTLYVSKLASKKLRSFLPTSVSYDEGKLDLKIADEFLIDRLLIRGEGNRPRMLLLISEHGVGLEVALRIKIDLADCISAMLETGKLSDSVSEQMELTDYCEQFDVAFELQEKKLGKPKTQVRLAQSTARTARMTALASVLGTACLACFGFYGLFSKPNDVGQPEVTSLASQLTDLELRFSRNSVQVNELSGLISKRQLEDLETRLKVVEAEYTIKPTPQQSAREIRAAAIDVTCAEAGMFGGLGRDEIEVKQFEQSKVFDTKAGDLVLATWIEVLGGLEKSDFKILESVVSDTGQIELRYQRSSESKNAIKGNIKVHFLYR